MRRALALALASSVFLAGCGSGGDDATDKNPASEPSGEGAGGVAPPVADADVVAAYDLASACELLDVAEVETAVGGMGWGVITEEPAQCTYQDPDATHTVTLSVTEVAEYDGFVGVDVTEGASGMRAVADRDTYAQLWAPAGADAAVVLTQQPALLSRDAMVALTERAAIALENAPLASDGSPDGANSAGGPGGAAPLTAGLDRVRIDGVIPSTGNTIGIEVTAARVAEAAAPAFTSIACVGGSGDRATTGSYAVLAMDAGISAGLRLAQLEITDEFAGPGTYQAAVSLTEADGDSFDLTGTMTVGASLDEGTYDVRDRSGAQVTGSWVCEFGS